MILRRTPLPRSQPKKRRRKKYKFLPVPIDSGRSARLAALRQTRKPIKKVNVTRKAREFARAYHSKERVAWVKSLPCLVCVWASVFFARGTAGSSHNAHTVGGGASRKAGYATIVPLCAGHHRRYDEHQVPLDSPAARQALRAMAANVQAAWLSHLQQGSET